MVTPNKQIRQKKLRRLAGRALRVLERHIAAHPALQILEPTLRPAVSDFVVAHSAVAGHRTNASGQTSVIHRAATTLRDRMQLWAALVQHGMPDLDPDTLRVTVGPPDDLLNAAADMLGMLDDESTRIGSLAYAQEMRADIAGAMELLTAEQQALQDSLAREQQLRAAARLAGARLHDELIALRLVLAKLLGRSHRDYQKLRMTKGAGAAGLQADDDDDDDVGEDSSVIEAIGDSDRIDGGVRVLHDAAGEDAAA